MYFFEDNYNSRIKHDTLEHAYLCLLNKDLVSAKYLFSEMDSPRAKWGYSLVEILNQYLVTKPTYFQLRNFYEIDLDLFIKNELLDYVENMLGALDYLVNINSEVYKYAARVLLENKIYKSARIYMDKSNELYYRDPELHFMYSKYCFIKKDFKKSLYEINECLNILPEYYPAKLMKKQIDEMLY